MESIRDLGEWIEEMRIHMKRLVIPVRSRNAAEGKGIQRNDAAAKPLLPFAAQNNEPLRGASCAGPLSPSR